MGKAVLGAQRFTYFMPTVLVGANVDDKPKERLI